MTVSNVPQAVPVTQKDVITVEWLKWLNSVQAASNQQKTSLNTVNDALVLLVNHLQSNGYITSAQADDVLEALG